MTAERRLATRRRQSPPDIDKVTCQAQHETEPKISTKLSGEIETQPHIGQIWRDSWPPASW